MGELFTDKLFVSRGLIAFFVLASLGTLWSGLALPLAAAPWHLNTVQIGLFGLAGLVGALGAARAGRWADARLASTDNGGSLVLLAVSWLAIAPVAGPLPLVVLGVLVLDFAVQAIHVSNQHLLTARHAGRTSSVVGGYMPFYSLGSTFGAAFTSATYDHAGWRGSCIGGAGLAVCGLAVCASSTRVAREATNGAPGRQRLPTR